MRTVVYDSESLPAERWAELCAGDAQATIFHSREWSLLWQCARNDARAEWWVLVDNDGRWIGGLPLVRFTRFGITRLYSQPLGSYGGWVGEGSEGEGGAVSDWLRRLKRRSVAEVVITPWHTDGTIAYPGRKVPRERFVIDLSAFAEGQSWKTNLRRNVVRNLKSAALRNWKIKLVRNPDDVERTRELWQQTFTRHRRRLDQSSWELYRLLPEFFAPGDRLFWWTASDDCTPVATTIGFRFGDRYFAYNGAMDLSRKDWFPMHALYERAINMAVSLGCLLFDFGSGPASDKDLAHFKKGWGAVAEPYTEYHFKRIWWPKR